MRKLLLITTALVGFSIPDATHAGPVIAGAAFLFSGAGFGAVTSVFGLAAGTTAFAVTMAGIKLAGSILMSRAVTKLTAKTPAQQVQRAELAQPTSLPAKRFAYGRCWAPGTPVDWCVTGKTLWVCYLLNSRPSALTSYTIFLDKRSASVSGDPFALSGAGATIHNAPFSGHVKFWIGRGSQAGPPAAFVSGTSGHFVATDRWKNSTVAWFRFESGANDTFRERWPSTPPELNILGDWSLLRDPRNGTTAFSRNQALIVLDALQNNPLKRYDDRYLDIESFKWAADVAAEPVLVRSGAAIPRYRADGVMVFASGSEIEDQLEPLLAAGASRFVRVGGRLALLPACPQPITHTITDFTDGQPIHMSRWQPSDDVFSEGAAQYISEDRHYEMAEAPSWVAPGAAAEDGGSVNRIIPTLDFVVDHRQAQRLTKIAVMRSRYQRTVSAEAFGSAFDLVAGSWARLQMPAPYGAWNGAYEVTSINPTAGINDDQSITVRVPLTLRETAAEIYSWDAATEEKPVLAPGITGDPSQLLPPAIVTLSTGTGVSVSTPGGSVSRIRVDWPESVSASTTGYEVEYRVYAPPGASGIPSLVLGALSQRWLPLAVTSETVTRAFLSTVFVSSPYQVRVRTIGLRSKSEWVESDAIIARGLSATLAAPQLTSAIGGAAHVSLEMVQSPASSASQIEVWGGDTSAVDSADLLAVIDAPMSSPATYVDAGLAPGPRRYWIRARNASGAASGTIGPVAATVT